MLYKSGQIVDLLASALFTRALFRSLNVFFMKKYVHLKKTVQSINLHKWYEHNNVLLQKRKKKEKNTAGLSLLKVLYKYINKIINLFIINFNNHRV